MIDTSKMTQDDCMIFTYKISEEERKRLVEDGIMTKEEIRAKYLYLKPVPLEEVIEAIKIHEHKLLTDDEYYHHHAVRNNIPKPTTEAEIQRAKEYEQKMKNQ